MTLGSLAADYIVTSTKTVKVDDLGVGGTIMYDRRPVLHRGSLFYKTSATGVSIVAGAVLNGRSYSDATAVTMPGSFTFNTDYAIWQNVSTGALVADASFVTAPAGALGGAIIGGFHYVPSGRPTALNSGSPTAASEILEYSLWDLTYRPSCPDPRGMVCVNDMFWIDLYLSNTTCYAGSTFSAVPTSKINVTIASGTNSPLLPALYGGNGTTSYGSYTWFQASEMASSFGKRLPSYAEFVAAAFGAPEETSRGSDVATVLWERVSKFGLAQATGVKGHYGADTFGSGASGATWIGGTVNRGGIYAAEARFGAFGGNFSNTTYSGSRCIILDAQFSTSNTYYASRFAAGHYQR